MKKVILGTAVIALFSLALPASAEEDTNAWTVFNIIKPWSKSAEPQKNNEWAMFNSGTTLWKSEGSVLPSQEESHAYTTAKTDKSLAVN